MYAYTYVRIHVYRDSFRFISQRSDYVYAADERRGASCATFPVVRTRQCIPQVPVNRSVLGIPLPDFARRNPQAESRSEPRCTRMHRPPHIVVLPRQRDDVSGSEGFFSRRHRSRRTSQVCRTVRSRSAAPGWSARHRIHLDSDRACMYTFGVMSTAPPRTRKSEGK